MSIWYRMDTHRPRDSNKSVLLLTKTGTYYVGKARYGTLGEPQQDEFAWRCDSSGRFTDPTHWMPLPDKPEGQS